MRKSDGLNLFGTERQSEGSTREWRCHNQAFQWNNWVSQLLCARSGNDHNDHTLWPLLCFYQGLFSVGWPPLQCRQKTSAALLLLNTGSLCQITSYFSWKLFMVIVSSMRLYFAKAIHPLPSVRWQEERMWLPLYWRTGEHVVRWEGYGDKFTSSPHNSFFYVISYKSLWTIISVVWKLKS